MTIISFDFYKRLWYLGFVAGVLPAPNFNGVRTSRKSLAQMIEATLPATYYPELITAADNLSNQEVYDLYDSKIKV